MYAVRHRTYGTISVRRAMRHDGLYPPLRTAMNAAAVNVVDVTSVLELAAQAAATPRPPHSAGVAAGHRDRPMAWLQCDTSHTTRDSEQFCSIDFPFLFVRPPPNLLRTMINTVVFDFLYSFAILHGEAANP